MTDNQTTPDTERTCPVCRRDDGRHKMSCRPQNRRDAAARTSDAERAERLAEWLCQNFYRDHGDDDWTFLDETGRDVWRQYAAEALTALDPQEPTS